MCVFRPDGYRYGTAGSERYLADNYIRPDESNKAQSKVKEKGSHDFIDKVKVRLVDSKYWAEVEKLRT